MTLHDICDKYEKLHGSSYMTQMWRVALSHLDTGEAFAQTRGALPYLPKRHGSDVVFDSDMRLLDVGCLGGYGLYDLAHRCEFAPERLPAITGIDVDQDSVAFAQDMASVWARHLNVQFTCCRVEDYRNAEPFDLIICRLVLPYTDVQVAIQSMSQLLAPGGRILLQVHAPTYYWRQLKNNLRSFRRVCYYFRPLLHGMVFSLMGRQILRLSLRETALSRGLVSRLCRKEGLCLDEVIGDTEKPMYWFRKEIRDAGCVMRDAEACGLPPKRLRRAC
jgi:2-polyprenyl-3-methyl-5-hydroxy-6-metoxy-1,4-benzoquinol methylase